MAKVKFSDLNLSCHMLLEQQQFDQLARVLEPLLPSIQNPAEWNELLSILQIVPQAVRLEFKPIAKLYAKVLAMNQSFSDLLEFSDLMLERHGLPTAAAVQLERAGALLGVHRYGEAHEVLVAVLPHLNGEALGVALTRLGLSAFYLGEPWEDTFKQARGWLSGVELGRALLNQGFCLSESHRNLEARSVWIEALPHFQTNHKLLAWTRYNLGISALRDLEPGAERHFLEAQRLAKNPKIATMRASILNGLAASRRAVGEWSRAEASYREAIVLAQDPHDRQDAYSGLARTLRLAARPDEALEILEYALQDNALNHNYLHVARATTFLALGQNTAAREEFTRVTRLASTSDQWLEKVARAELARREGNLEQAVELLDGFPIQTLHAREEAVRFPELMQLLAAAEKPIPKALEYLKGIIIRVVAQGVLGVWVNDRPVNIAPTGRAGELLVYLLEHNGSASVEMITDALFSGDRVPDHDKARGLIWKWVKGLRQVFGWEQSVIALRAAYQLDPSVIWEYDVNEARATRSFQGEFLKGVYSDWALEVGRSLDGIARFKRRSGDLN